jgi:purine-binding chemotaxis protein CheW
LKKRSQSFLIVQAGALRCALPLSEVREIMRPLPLKKVSGLASGVLGIAVIRGAALPVLSLGRLLRQGEEVENRLVVMRTPGRDCALLVGSVHGISDVDASAWEQMPKLLARVDFADQIQAEDAELMVSLSMARLLAELPLPEQTLL